MEKFDMVMVVDLVKRKLWDIAVHLNVDNFVHFDMIGNDYIDNVQVLVALELLVNWY